MNQFITTLSKLEGHYTGFGINHDQQEFKGELFLKPIINSSGIEIVFIATGNNGEIYHEEKTLIATDDQQKPAMWSLNSNAPMLFKFEVRANNESEIVFGLNDPQDRSKFREEIKLEIINNDQIGYHYSWGLPDGDFQYRSGLTMKKF